MLMVPVLPCPTQVIVPRLFPVVSTATDHHTDGCQPREGSRTALVVNPYMHSHTNIIASTHISTVFNAMTNINPQRASVKVLVNDKL